MAATAFVTALPKVKLGGRESGSLTQGLTRLAIHDRCDGLYSCEATFGNWGPTGASVGYLYFDRAQLDFGKPFAIALEGTTLFEGRITGLEAEFPEGRSAEITVLAEDRLQDLRMTRRTRTFTDTTDAEVFRSVAGDHSLTPDVDVSGPQHRVLAQVDQSDLAFLRERAHAIDAELWVDGTTLHATTYTRRAGGRLRVGYGKELHELTVLADLAHQRSSLTVGGWDVAGKQAIAERADDTALAGELGSGDSGASILERALAARHETAHRTQPSTPAEAKARAESLFRARARGFVSGTAIADTDAALRVGITLQIDGVGPLFSGDYRLVDVVHRYDLKGGLKSHLTVERPALGRP
jgi:phage protein D